MFDKYCQKIVAAEAWDAEGYISKRYVVLYGIPTEFRNPSIRNWLYLSVVYKAPIFSTIYYQNGYDYG
jgi:hypothetical protein